MTNGWLALMDFALKRRKKQESLRKVKQGLRGCQRELVSVKNNFYVSLFWVDDDEHYLVCPFLGTKPERDHFYGRLSGLCLFSCVYFLLWYLVINEKDRIGDMI